MDSDQTQPLQLQPQPLSFTGSGGEYFRIWIVNALLTVLTLGIYSAWAKVRRLQYFYRNTHLAGASFDYHGNPLSILVGRIIALVLLFAYNQSAHISLQLWGITLLVLALVMPWLLRQSFRFRLRNSSYRGLRFRFSGSIGGAYETFLLYGILAVITFYLAAPLFHQRLKQYQHGNSWYGNTQASFHAGAGGFYAIYGRLFLMMILFIILFGVAAAFFIPHFDLHAGHDGKPDPMMLGFMVILFTVAVLIGSLLIGPYVAANLQNLIWNNTRLGEHRFRSTATTGALFWIYLTNFLGMLLTLGLFMPWAQVRLARYRASTLTLLPASDLEEFAASQEQEVAAVGDATAEFFDIDIGL